MARQSYQKRIERGLARGQTRQEARGHGRTPERPLGALRQPERYLPTIRRRIDYYTALARTPAGRTALANVNRRRAAQNKPPIYIEEPPAASREYRLREVEDLERAEQYLSGVPDPYRAIYIDSRGGIIAVRIHSIGRRSKAA